MDMSTRKRLAERVAELGRTEHEHIHMILHSNGVRYTRNNNGVFCDITRCPDRVLAQIEEFIQFSAKSADLLNAEARSKATAPQPMAEVPRKQKPGGGGGGSDGPTQAYSNAERVRIFENSLTKARMESSVAKRKESCRYMQMKKKYSRPAASKHSYANELSPESEPAGEPKP